MRLGLSQEDDLESKFCRIMRLLQDIYTYLNSNAGCFENKNYFFSLYCVLYNQVYGITSVKLNRKSLFNETSLKDKKNLNLLYSAISQFISDFETNIADKKNTLGKYVDYSEFEKNHKLRTTNRSERLSRITFLNDTLISY